MAHFLIYRSPRCGDIPPASIAEQIPAHLADDLFRNCVASGLASPRNGRRVVITGPDYTVQPEDYTDPLVTGEEGVKRALTPEEYEAYLGLTAAALLEA
jgi:hypothetical protein